MPSRCCTSLTMRLSIRVQLVTLVSLQADLFLNCRRNGWLLVIEPSEMIYTFLFQYSNKARHQLKWGRLNWFYPFCFIQKTFSLQTFLLLPHISGLKEKKAAIQSLRWPQKIKATVFWVRSCALLLKLNLLHWSENVFSRFLLGCHFSHVSSSVI